jgi:predicted RNA-binding protein
MCLAKAYMEKEGGEPLLADIASVEVKDGKLLLRTLFGEQKEVDGSISYIDFMKSNIRLAASA